MTKKESEVEEVGEEGIKGGKKRAGGSPRPEVIDLLSIYSPRTKINSNFFMISTILISFYEQVVKTSE